MLQKKNKKEKMDLYILCLCSRREREGKTINSSVVNEIIHLEKIGGGYQGIVGKQFKIFFLVNYNDFQISSKNPILIVMGLGKKCQGDFQLHCHCLLY